MSAYSSLTITQSQAKRIWKSYVSASHLVDFAEMERFFDKVMDEQLYNVCIAHDATDRKTDEALVEDSVHRYMLKNPQGYWAQMADDEQILRELLAIRVGGANLYTDDGELQDNSMLPAIDFKRDSAQTIRDKLRERNRRLNPGVFPA